MAEQEGKQALMIQLPWTVPQQENTQAVILQQPNGQKVFLDLNHSTDTTAIWSFVIAMVIALILGISATIIAIWYGRKSFDLTEMSFKTVIEQIKNSEQSALHLNTKLFEQQIALQKIDLAFKEKLAWNQVVSSVAAECNILVSNFIFKSNEFSKYYLNVPSKFKATAGHLTNEKIKELEQINEKLILQVSKLDLYLELNDKNHERIIKILDYFTMLADQLILEFINKTQIESLDTFIDLSHIEYGDNKVIILGMWDNGTKKNRLEILSLLMRELSGEFKNNLRKKGE